MKPSQVQVLMLEDPDRGIPRGKFRKEITANERIKKLEFRRNMSSSEVKNVVLRGFQHLPSLVGFTLLEADHHGRLHVSENQNPDGQYIIESARRRHGPVYLCDKEVCVI